MQNKLVIIDGNSLFYRSFYALPLLSNANGEYSNAVYGFAIQIAKIIQEIKPTHIAVAFDAGKHTFRNDLYSGYKATRKPMPSELRSQIEPLKHMLKLMNIHFCEQVGVEGDDIVGTLAKRFSDTETIIVTADRDTLQLIDKTTKVYFTKKGTSELYIVDEAVLKQDYGVLPDQIVDLKALQGDTSDNIPGVAGIGPKKAQQLIENYGGIKGVYEHIEDFSGKLKEYLETGKDNAFISYNLAKIKTDVDLDCTIEDCQYSYPFSAEVQAFFKQYEFKSLLKRTELFEQKTENTEVQKLTIKSINSQEIAEKVLKFTQNSGKFAFFENKNNWHFSDGNTEYVLSIDSEFYAQNKEYILQWLQVLFVCPAKKIVFDSKHLKHYFAKLNIDFAGDIFDVSIAKHLVDGVSVKSAGDVFIAEEDWQTPATILYGLQQEYQKQLEAFGMIKLYNEVELPLVDVLFDMERLGFKIDIDVLEELSKQYKNELHQLEEEIFDLVGERFNVNSPKQLGEILFDKLGLKGGRKKSTSAEKLESLKGSHPVIEKILRYRKVAKLNSTYIEGFRPHLDEYNMVHTVFKQTLTNTGRLSSTEPNLQNIPNRGEEGRIVRSMFVARQKDHVLIDADYSQIELRLLAHLSDDDYFVEAFRNETDIHSLTASQVYGVPVDAVTKDMRRVAKVVNFGIIYGISEYGLSSDLHISAWDAKDLIDNFYAKHPKVKSFMENAVKLAKETGRVSTILGRSRKMVEIHSTNYMVRSMAERASQNMPLQGSAADIVKIAMVKVYNKIKEQNLQAKLILQVHDELIIDCPKNEEEQVKKLVKECMESAYKLSVPLTVDVASSYRWSEGH